MNLSKMNQVKEQVWQICSHPAYDREWYQSEKFITDLKCSLILLPKLLVPRRSRNFVSCKCWQILNKPEIL